MASSKSVKNKFTNLDKIFWPGEGFTKGDVINYYNSVYKYIIRYLKGRPQSLFRTPNGIKEKGFFHKDAGEQAPDWIGKYPSWSETANKEINYLVCNDKPSLLYIANLGCIELNPWNSTVENPDNPDYLIIDIDPSANNTYDQVIEVALATKAIFDKAGVPSFCKTSGATGMHVYVPLGAKYSYEQARMFAEIVATMVQTDLPTSTTLERSLSKRGENHIYIDFLQNKIGSTLACAYSLRPKPGAPVSTPLHWQEVKKGIRPEDYNIKNTFKRLEKKGDLFSGIFKKAISIEKCIKKLNA